MTGLRYDRCREAGCRARVIWASSAATGARMCLEAAQVVPGTLGAYVVIAGQAFTQPDAVAHITRTHNVPDDEAHSIATTDFTWHLHHNANCSTNQIARSADI